VEITSLTLLHDQKMPKYNQLFSCHLSSHVMKGVYLPVQQAHTDNSITIAACLPPHFSSPLLLTKEAPELQKGGRKATAQ